MIWYFPFIFIFTLETVMTMGKRSLEDKSKNHKEKLKT